MKILESNWGCATDLGVQNSTASLRDCVLFVYRDHPVLNIHANKQCCASIFLFLTKMDLSELSNSNAPTVIAVITAVFMSLFLAVIARRIAIQYDNERCSKSSRWVLYLIMASVTCLDITEITKAAVFALASSKYLNVAGYVYT